MLMFSMMPPSTSSKANPLQLRKVQLAMVTLRKPPVDSVPNLIRPIPPRLGSNLPASSAPSLKPETWQLTMDGRAGVQAQVDAALQVNAAA